MLFEKIDTNVLVSILKFLNKEEIEKLSLIIPKVRKLYLQTDFKLWWFENRYNLKRPEDFEIKLFLQCAENFIQHINQQCEVESGESLKILNSDEHRKKCFEKECDLCKVIDDKDITRIFIHFFNLFPLVFKTNTAYGTNISHSVGNIFYLYAESPYEIDGNPYGYPIFETSWQNGEKWEPKNIQDHNYLDRLRKIPTWFLRKYYNYLKNYHNHLYKYFLNEVCK